MSNLQRFLDAQKGQFELALEEIRNGRKRGHWMWYMFPQIRGLGKSDVSVFYAINNIHEAHEYLNHRILGERLVRITSKLLDLREDNAYIIFGSPDDMKLRSCMTLFSLISDTNPVFKKVLVKYFDGKEDIRTLEIVAEMDK